MEETYFKENEKIIKGVKDVKIYINEKEILIDYEDPVYATVFILTLWLDKMLISWPNKIVLLRPSIEIESRDLLDEKYEETFNILFSAIKNEKDRRIILLNSKEDNEYISSLDFFTITN